MTINQELKEVTCATCNVIFAISDNMMVRLKLSHKSFYCPNGHGNIYSAETEVDKLKKQLERKTNELISLYTELKRKDQELADAAIEIINLKKKSFFGLFSK